MMIKKIFFLLSLLVCFISSLVAYQRPVNVEPEVWDKLTPYFLPEDHPVKEKLDSIFANAYALATIENLKKLGFKNIKQRRSEMVVASHNKLKGFKVKLFLHTYPLPEWWFFTKRIEGAELIRASIHSHGFEDILKVPKKWIYPIVHSDFHRQTNSIKNFIMIVEDMQIYPGKSNTNYFHNDITKKELFAIYTIINELLLIDSVYIDNIPRCLDQKFAFIDTEHYLTTEVPIPWQRLLLAVNSKRRGYLQGLIDGNIKE